MNGVAEEVVGSVAIPKSAEVSKPENDGFVRIGVEVVFHLDVLKPWMPKADEYGDAYGVNTKKQMSLELDDWW